MTVEDITKLKSLQNFKLLAGEKGMRKLVTVAGILDHEYLDNKKPFRAEAFDKNSFVISSLLFAKDNSSLLLPAIEGLYKSGISSFAFKTVIFENLPQEVLDFADKNSLPIFKFSDIEFENVIFEIMDAVKTDDHLIMVEKNIEKMIEYNLTRSEVAVLTKGISANFRQNAKAAYISGRKNKSEMNKDVILRRFYANMKLSSKAVMCKIKDELIIIITMDMIDKMKFQVIIEEILEYCSFGEDLTVGYSDFHSSYEGMDYCLRESYYASCAGRVEGKANIDYKQIGTYQILIPNKNSDEFTSFMFRYLEPILCQEEQLKTAIEYFLAKGDVNETANRLICHKNTVRYRVNKLHETLDAQATAFVFYENLSTAIKIYLLKTL